VQRWNLLEIDAPDGTRDPVVLATEDAARAVLIRLEAGQALGDHEVKERAWMCVVDGAVSVEAAGQAFEASSGTLVVFDPQERHAIRSAGGARILLLLAPWPGEGHYRGEKRGVAG
jgi:quercetin dioxygenase-like cupin family protein